MFGLGVERYDQLINLILTLRRPQLAKNLDPKGLSQALTDGLRPLDDQLVLEAARSFSDMEEVGRALEGLAAADQAAQSFVGVYAKYLRQQARSGCRPGREPTRGRSFGHLRTPRGSGRPDP